MTLGQYQQPPQTVSQMLADKPFTATVSCAAPRPALLQLCRVGRAVHRRPSSPALPLFMPPLPHTQVLRNHVAEAIIPTQNWPTQLGADKGYTTASAGGTQLTVGGRLRARMRSSAGRCRGVLVQRTRRGLRPASAAPCPAGDACASPADAPPSS